MKKFNLWKKFFISTALIYLIISYNKIRINLNRFQEILPRISLNDINYPSIKEVFESRNLYISDKNLTNEYIHYLRNIDNSKERKYYQNLYEGLEPNIDFLFNRKNQININKFYNICNEEKLISQKEIKYNRKPLISVIMIAYNKAKVILKSLRSIQNQSLKNIEIIIVNDCSTDDSRHILDSLLKTDPRIRIFTHLKNMGAWRSRLDGFLYSNAPYVIHFDSGDFYSDNLILEDAYYLVTKYNLDSLRFAFQLTKSEKNLNFHKRVITFKKGDRKIVYGRRKYSIYGYRFGTIWNRLVRANIFLKGLDYLDEYILNAYKNIFEDRWWNTLANNCSYSYLMINRIGYIYLKLPGGEGKVRAGDEKRNEKSMREIIYFWLFDYLISYKQSDKKDIINEIVSYKNNHVLNFSCIKNNFPPLNHLLDLLINDNFIKSEDKMFLKSFQLDMTNNSKHN